MSREEMDFAPPMPEPPTEGRPGLMARLLEAGARVIIPDLRGFGASGKLRTPQAYTDSAMARDVAALVDRLDLEAVDVLGFSMGSVTAAKLLRSMSARSSRPFSVGSRTTCWRGRFPCLHTMAEHCALGDVVVMW